jgi:hypothetical protein
MDGEAQEECPGHTLQLTPGADWPDWLSRGGRDGAGDGGGGSLAATPPSRPAAWPLAERPLVEGAGEGGMEGCGEGACGTKRGAASGDWHADRCRRAQRGFVQCCARRLGSAGLSGTAARSREELAAGSGMAAGCSGSCAWRARTRPEDAPPELRCAAPAAAAAPVEGAAGGAAGRAAGCDAAGSALALRWPEAARAASASPLRMRARHNVALLSRVPGPLPG